MEAPTPTKPVIKPEISIELKLKSDKNLNYDISIYYIEDRLFLTGITKNIFQNKRFENQFSLEEVKKINFFIFMKVLRKFMMN